MQVMLGIAIGVVYGIIRLGVSSNVGEAISAGVFLGIFYVVTALRVRIKSLSDMRKLFSVDLNSWFSLLLAVAVVMIGVIRFGMNYREAILDGVLIYFLFTMFAAIFAKTKNRSD